MRFTGVKPGKGGVSSEPFTYSVASDTGDDVLVLADEDYTGVNPDYPAGVTAPKYAADYEKAINDAGYSTDVWDIDERGRPARPRRPRPLRRRRLVPRRQPAHAGSRGRDHHHAVRGAARHRRGREGAVHDDGRPRLPEQRRQAGPCRRDRAVLRSAGHRRRRRRSVLRAERRPRGRVRRRHRPRVLRGLPDHGRRLPAVLPRRLQPDRQREPGERGRGRRSHRRVRGDVRRAGHRG